MNRDQEIRRLFDQALDVPSDERTAWLDKECDDSAIRAEVKRLLKHDPGTNAPESPPGLGTALLRPKLPPKTRVGDYEIVRELGRGSMGAVYLAREVSLDRLVALKMVVAPAGEGEALLERFRREARMLAKLDHRGIVPVHRVGEVEGRHFIAMAYIPGETLGERLARERSEREEGTAVPTRKGKTERERDVASLLADVAEALDHAHRAGVIHRDVKPSNIMIDEEGQTHLMDFGIARDLSREGLTIEGAILGTCRYMSPEQARAAREEIDARSDVFSLGVVLYEAITLQQPFGGETVDEILGQVIKKEPKRLRSIDPGIPKDLDTIVHKAMEKERKHRFQSAAHLAADLRSFVNGHFILARPPTFARKLREKALEHKLIVAASLTLIFGLVVGGLVQAWRLSLNASLSIYAINKAEFDSTAHAWLSPMRVREYADEKWALVPSNETYIGILPIKSASIEPDWYRLRIADEDGEILHESIIELRLREAPTLLIKIVEMEASPKDMVLIASRYELGSFWIDRFEITNGQYKEFVDDTGYKRPAWWREEDYENLLWDRLPVVGISQIEASAYAAWVGKRLPNELEWLVASAGYDINPYPWPESDQPVSERANAAHNNIVTCIMPPTPNDPDANLIEHIDLVRRGYFANAVAVDQFAEVEHFADYTQSGEGLLHVYGNVAEWVATFPLVEINGKLESDVKLRRAKGDFWGRDPEHIWDLFSAHMDAPPNGRYMGIGFRCARSAVVTSHR